jgi:predicted ATPase
MGTQKSSICMPILSAEINFQQLRGVRLDFSEPATGAPMSRICLIGPNGTGKSTVLNLLAGKLRGAPLLPNINVHFAPDQPSPILTLWSPPDSEQAPTPEAMGQATLGAARKLGEIGSFFPIHQGATQDFWLRVLASIHQRDASWLTLLQAPASGERKVSDLRQEFEVAHPDALQELAALWNRILEPGGLEFDPESVRKPVNQEDRLEAHIRLKETKQPLPWNALSTGIRQFLFRIGHIHMITRRFPEQSGVLLMDEPEASLHPAFLYELIDFYQQAAPGLQIIVATHSPIIAGQFSAHQRFALDFDSKGFVTVRRGRSPEGDDPNDVLTNDFGVESLGGQMGEAAWARYFELDRLLQTNPKGQQASAWAAEYLKLGREFQFPALDEVSQ